MRAADHDARACYLNPDQFDNMKLLILASLKLVTPQGLRGFVRTRKKVAEGQANLRQLQRETQALSGAIWAYPGILLKHP